MSPSGMPITAVLADEHNLFRAGLVRLLQSHAIYTLAETQSGEEALELVSQKRPQIAIISLTLAGQTGLEVIHALRTHDRDLPILALSPNYSQLAWQSALRAGASSLFSKNQDIQQFVQLIQDLAQQPRPDLRKQRRKEKYISLRQLRILKALTSGHTNEEIARNLSFSRSTIKAEIRQLFDTFATQDRSQLVSQAAKHGLIGVTPN